MLPRCLPHNLGITTTTLLLCVPDTCGLCSVEGYADTNTQQWFGQLVMAPLSTCLGPRLYIVLLIPAIALS